MQTTLRFAPAPRIAWLLVAIALFIGLLSAILVVGSRRPVAPPFGLARNGPIAYTKGGDILRFDPATGTSMGLVTGIAQDIAPYFSPDGQRFVFLRQVGGKDYVAIADADGRGIRILTGPLDGQRWWDWSRDGARLVIVSEIDGKSAITIAKTDGSGTSVVPLDMEADNASWLGAESDRILFRGRPLSGGTSGLFTVKPDGTDRVQVSPDMGDALGDYQSPTITPDGSEVAYSAFDEGTWHSPTAGAAAYTGGILRVHVLDLRTGKDKAIPIGADPTSPDLPVDQWGPRLSPDGTMLAFQVDRKDGTYQIAVAHTDGSDLPRAVGPSARNVTDQSPNYDFSPDGTKVNVRYPSEGAVWALPVDGSPGSMLPWDDVDLPTTQRLAP
jgi:Tol biopolymer transport system component